MYEIKYRFGKKTITAYQSDANKDQFLAILRRFDIPIIGIQYVLVIK